MTTPTQPHPLRVEIAALDARMDAVLVRCDSSLAECAAIRRVAAGRLGVTVKESMVTA